MSIFKSLLFETLLNVIKTFNTVLIFVSNRPIMFKTVQGNKLLKIGFLNFFI